MISFPIPSMHEDIRALWKDTFGDSEAFVSHYFNHMHRDDNMLVCTEGDEEIVAMLSMLPIVLQSGAHVFTARYIYAVATAKQWRGLGIATALMEQALSWMKDNGEAAAILAPAHFSLFPFYENLGFSTEFYVHEELVQSNDLPKADGEVFYLEAEELYTMRNQSFQDSRLFAKWDAASLDYIVQSVQHFGGFALRFACGNGHGYAIGAMEEDLCAVKELVLFGMDKTQGLALLHSRVNAPRYLLHQHSDGDDDPMPFGMIHWLDENAKQSVPDDGQDPYFALVMD